MVIKYCKATTDDELTQILELQAANHALMITESQATSNGFVTVRHSFELLKQMHEAAPQIIAKDQDKVIGYALVMLKSFEAMIPVLQPMFDRLATIPFRNHYVTEHRFYVMGQICVQELYRGKGVFDELYQTHKRLLSPAYDLCVTSVSTRNKRSMRAHERVGFQVLNTFRDATDEWSILVWPL
jgi:ribosomal protein S18 acetylase RimI-like enzyme